MNLRRMYRVSLFLVGAILGYAAICSAAQLTVLNARHEPVPNADVVVWVPGPHPSEPVLGSSRLSGKTNHDGVFEQQIPDVDGTLIDVDGAGYLPYSGSLSRDRKVELADGLSLHGLVRGTDGATVLSGAACVDWVDRVEDWITVRERHRCARVGQDGRFLIRGLHGGRISLRVKVDGYLPVRQEVTVGEAAWLTLQPGIQVEGRVVRDSRDSAADAGIVCRSGLRESVERDGRFHLTLPKEGTLCRAESVGFRPSPWRRLPLDNVQEVVTFHLTSMAAVASGSVVLPSAKDVPRFDLAVERLDGPGAWVPTHPEFIQSHGKFEIRFESGGTFRVSLRAEGFKPVSVPVFSIRSRQSLDLGLFALDQGAGVDGAVIDSQTGRPIAGADIALRASGVAGVLAARDEKASHRSVTDQSGEFRLTGLTAGSYQLSIRKAGYVETLRRFTLNSDQSKHVGDIELGQGITVDGRVSDRWGNGRSNLQVEFYADGDAEAWPRVTASTDEQGEFSPVRLGAGNYRAVARGRRVLAERALTLDEGEKSKRIELEVHTTRVHGTVVDGTSPVVGGFLVLTNAGDPALRRGKVVVETLGSRGSTKVVNGPQSEIPVQVRADGTFFVEDSPVGTVLARYVGLDGRDVRRSITIPDQSDVWTEISISGAQVRGVVVDAESGAKIAGARVTAQPAGRGAPFSTFSGPGGEFLVSGVEDGSYVVSAAAQGYRDSEGRSLQVASESPPEPIELPLKRGEGGALRVSLVREAGDPAAGVMVSVLDRAGRMVRSLPTGRDGMRMFEDLSPGQYVLTWSDPAAGAGCALAPPVHEGEVAQLNQPLVAGRELVLKCASDTCGKQNLVGLSVVCSQGVDVSPDLAGLRVGLQFSGAGSLNLGLLAPGQYEVEAQAANLAASRRAVVEPHGSPLVISLR